MLGKYVVGNAGSKNAGCHRGCSRRVRSRTRREDKAHSHFPSFSAASLRLSLRHKGRLAQRGCSRPSIPGRPGCERGRDPRRGLHTVLPQMATVSPAWGRGHPGLSRVRPGRPHKTPGDAGRAFRVRHGVAALSLPTEAEATAALLGDRVPDLQVGQSRTVPLWPSYLSPPPTGFSVRPA